MAHRGCAVRIDLQPGGDRVGDSQLLQYFRDVDSGRRRFGIRNEDGVGRKKRRPQCGRVGRADLRVACANRECRLDQTDIRYRGGDDELF